MSRKIYFAGSIRGGRQDVGLYFKIIEELKEKYGTVLTEHVGDKNKKMVESSGVLEGFQSDKDVYDKDMAMLNECQYVVAEVTQPSLGVGYEIAQAVDMGKSILCLFRPGQISLSAMIKGADDNGETFVVKNYTELDQVEEILKEYFSFRS